MRNILNKENQKIIESTYNKVQKLFEPYYKIGINKNYQGNFTENRFTEKSKKILNQKDNTFRLLAYPIFEEISKNLSLEDNDIIAILSDHVNHFEKYKTINVLKEAQSELNESLTKITEPKKFRHLRDYSFDNIESSKLKNLGIVNLYMDILPKEDLEKFRYVVNESGLQSSRNFRIYEKPLISKLFPNTNKLFFDIIKNRFLFYLISDLIYKGSNFENLPFSDKFEFSDKYLYVFSSRRNLKILNKFLSTKQVEDLNQPFFNRLRYIVESTDIFNRITFDLNRAKKYRTLLEKESSLVKINRFKHNPELITNKKLEIEIKEIKEIIQSLG